MRVKDDKTENRSSFGENVEHVFDVKRRRRSQQAFDRNKVFLFRLGIAIGTLLLIILFSLTPQSRVSAVSITGTRYLSDAYVCSLAGVSADDLYYLQIPLLLQYRIKSDPLV